MPLSLLVSSLFVAAAAAAVVPGPDLKYDLSLIDTNKMNISAAPTHLDAKPNGATSSWVYYSQCDSQWSSQELGTCSGDTICSAGCAMTSVAMMLATKGVSVNPSSLDSWLTSNGGYASGCLIVWASVDAFGVSSFQGIETADESAICDGLSQNHGIIANVNGGAHWVLLTGCLGNGVFSVNDPGYSKTSYTMSEIVQEAVYH